MKLVKLKYCDEFHCTGPECPDHCCKEWTILFGKREYLDYKKADCSRELKNLINTSFERIRDHESMGLHYNEQINYVRIRLGENGECPLHGADGLCMIQKELGEKALCYTCKTFPRAYGLVGDEALIFGLHMTCPHVVELMLAHPEGLEVTEEEYNGNAYGADKGKYSLTGTSKDWEGYPQYWIIKSAQIDILQNRSFTIPERLLILGFFSKKADEYIVAGQGEKISNLYNMILDNEFCRNIADSLKTHQSDEAAATRCVDQFLKMYYWLQKGSINASNYLIQNFELVAQSINGRIERLLIDGGFQAKCAYSSELYFKNLGMFREIEADKEYIFENVLVNMTFLTTPHEGVFEGFFRLAIFYNILKISIPAFLKDEWDDTDLVLAISNSAKMIDNTKMAKRVSERDFVEHDSFDLAHVAFMIS